LLPKNINSEHRRETFVLKLNYLKHHAYVICEISALNRIVAKKDYNFNQ
jgi:hypothetical protein